MSAALKCDWHGPGAVCEYCTEKPLTTKYAASVTYPRFPNVEAMGVPVRKGIEDSGQFYAELFYVRAADLEAALAKAPVVYGMTADNNGGEHIFSGTPTNQDTHTARLVCVQPIVRFPEVKIDETIPPNEFHLLTSDGKRYKFRLEN